MESYGSKALQLYSFLVRTINILPFDRQPLSFNTLATSLPQSLFFWATTAGRLGLSSSSYRHTPRGCSCKWFTFHLLPFGPEPRQEIHVQSIYNVLVVVVVACVPLVVAVCGNCMLLAAYTIPSTDNKTIFYLFSRFSCFFFAFCTKFARLDILFANNQPATHEPQLLGGGAGAVSQHNKKTLHQQQHQHQQQQRAKQEQQRSGSPGGGILPLRANMQFHCSRPKNWGKGIWGGVGRVVGKRQSCNTSIKNCE